MAWAWDDLIFSAVTLVLPFLVGLIFFSKWLFRDVQVKWGIGFVSQLVFASTLAVSFQTHAAVLGEVSGLLKRSTREYLWTLDFSTLVILLKVIIPFLIFYAAISKRPGYSQSIKVLMTLLTEGAWLTFSSWGENLTRGTLDLQKETERLGLIGLASVAILSGWGAVHGPYSYGPWFIKNYDDLEITRVEQKLVSVMEMISALKRRRVIAQANQKSFSSYFSFGFFTSSKEENEEESLSLLSMELFLEYTEMRHAKQANLFRKTWLGKIYTFLGYTFAGYCFLKMIASGYGIIFPKTAKDPDLITKVLSYLILFARNPYEANFIAQTVSLIMVGVLIFNSFRGLLMTLGKVFHQVGPRDSSLVSLLLTEVMGHYLLSSIILLDLNVPFRYRGQLFLEKFEFFRIWSDILFLLAGFASAVTLYALDRARGSRTEFYSTTLHEKII